MRALDITGQRFGRLVARCLVGTRSSHRLWLADCYCGGQVAVTIDLLRKGKTQSCGCLRREVASATKTKHGALKGGITGGVYSVWAGMLNRCLNPNATKWKDYGGRGIVVCEAWKDYATFERDMGQRPTPKHTLDRYDNDGPYSPSNCRWATATEQAANRRPKTRKAR